MVFKWILNNQAVVAFHLTLIGFDGFDFHKDQSYFFTRHSVYDHYYVATGYFHAPLLFNKTFGTTCRKNGLNPNHVYLVIYAILGLVFGLGNFLTAIPRLTKIKF